MRQIIDNFTGEYRWLSNFYRGNPIEYAGKVYPTAEHLYQCFKVKTDYDEEFIRTANSPGEAKRRGGSVELRDDWEDVKVQAMYLTITAKFEDQGLTEKLLETGDATLIEGNFWHDNIWGDCRCGAVLCLDKGRNLLGTQLMMHRHHESVVRSL